MPITIPARPRPAPPYAISDGTACFGWPTDTMTRLEPVPALTGGWSLGGLTARDRGRYTTSTDVTTTNSRSTACAGSRVSSITTTPAPRRCSRRARGDAHPLG